MRERRRHNLRDSSRRFRLRRSSNPRSWQGASFPRDPLRPPIRLAPPYLLRQPHPTNHRLDPLRPPRATRLASHRTHCLHLHPSRATRTHGSAPRLRRSFPQAWRTPTGRKGEGGNAQPSYDSVLGCRDRQRHERARAALVWCGPVRRWREPSRQFIDVNGTQHGGMGAKKRERSPWRQGGMAAPYARSCPPCRCVLCEPSPTVRDTAGGAGLTSTCLRFKHRRMPTDTKDAPGPSRARDAAGSERAPRCACRMSKTMPYCDGTHMLLARAVVSEPTPAGDCVVVIVPGAADASGGGP